MELVGYEDVEARSHEALASLVVHVIQMICNHANKKDTYRYIGKTKEIKLKAQMSVKLDF